jgi:hypothetical protein
LSLILRNPKFQFVDSGGLPYAGGTLTFYLTGTQTPEDTYSNQGLSTVNANPITLNSAGWPATDIFLSPTKKYKVVLKDSSGNTIWTVDPVSTTDFAVVPLWSTTAGDPNGQLAGTAASSGVLPSMAWDRTNAIVYICTTTGSSSTAVWTAINAQAATAVVSPPQGYLRMTSETPVIITEVSAGTAVYYTPFVGNLVPIWNGSRMVPTEFVELTLSLVASHAASQIYDVFVFSNSGVLTQVTGPAWATPTAGSGDRGTGASTTELARLNGYWVNKVQITARNGSTTYTVGANLATYVGSIFMDGTNGQLTCHRAWGASRKWGVWNAYNRQRLYLKAGDSTASWTYNTNAFRPSNNATTNSLTVFQGLAEEWYGLRFGQRVFVNSAAAASASNGIGWNSTTAASGRTGYGQSDTQNGHNLISEYTQAPALGINVVTALETSPVPASVNVTWSGGEDDMILSAEWRG